MGKATGFLEYERVNPTKRPVAERLGDWNELRMPMEPAEAVQQAARCMNCGIPFCHGGVLLGGMAAGCPVHNLIPEWNDLVYKGQWKEAYQRLARTNPFAEFTARVCPAPCEGSCTEGHHMEPVTINSLEYEIIERAFAEGWVQPYRGTATGKRVAVVGSGPSGLSAAHYLTLAGHAVTVYERSDRIGGLMMYGIPNMKLDKNVLQRRIDLLERAGVDFVTNTEVGRELSAHQLVEDFDAVVLCAGATKARGLTGVPGSTLQGIHFAVDFLKANTKSLLDSNLTDGRGISAKDKHVIILGGGDTGTDCVATALRHGCKSVHQFEIMPEPPDERAEASNPWPEWPKKRKVDYGQEEAIDRMGSDPRRYCISTKKVEGNDAGQVTEIRTVQIAWVHDENGRMLPREVPGSEKVWKADLILLAMGFLGPEDTLPDALELERDARSNISAAFGKFQTTADKVFAAGDMRRGQSLVVWALEEGKQVARAVDQFLTGKTLLR